jgi:hypothetical protein
MAVGRTESSLICREVSGCLHPVHKLMELADEWDEFPNGRWGDSRSPAYGDLDGYPVSIGINVSLNLLYHLYSRLRLFP